MTSVRLGVESRGGKGKAAAFCCRRAPAPAGLGLSLCLSQGGSSGLLIILSRPMLHVGTTPCVLLVWMGSGL